MHLELRSDGIFRRINSADFSDLPLSNAGAAAGIEPKGFQLCPCRIRSFIDLSHWKMEAIAVSDSALNLFGV